MSLTRHLLQIIEAKREQDDTEEDGHHDGGRRDAVVEDVQPLWQLQVIDALLLIAQFRRHLGGNPGGDLLLVADGEPCPASHFLGWLEHDVGGDPPNKAP